jgi:UDP-3-O-[3-hydroxymyristoyl] glucosamine N-acyltransferase
VVLGAGAGVGPFCRLGRGVRIGRNTSIAERCSLGDGVTVGDEVTLHPGVTLYPGCRVGNRVEIHSGAVIGVDGYSIVLGEGVPEKVPSLGTVEIEDDVEIFANVTIARAAFDRTVIGRWSKVDCLCHVAHNCRLGQGVIVAAFGGLSGSVEVGDGAILAGGVGVVDHVRIGKGARIGAGSGIEHSVPDGEQMWGRPAKPAKLELRLQAVLKRLPDAWRTLQKLVKREESAAGEG